MEFRKSSYSTHSTSSCVEAAAAGFTRSAASVGHDAGNCVEAGTTEFTAGRCSDRECVQAGSHDGVIFVRDSKDPRCETGDFPHLHYRRDMWDGGRAVKFTPVPGVTVPPEIRAAASARGHDPAAAWYAVATLSNEDTGTILYFDQAEKDAWDKGVENSEFAVGTLAAA